MLTAGENLIADGTQANVKMPVDCSLCGRTMANAFGMARHLAVTHHLTNYRITADGKIECVECRHLSKSKSSHTKHFSQYHKLCTRGERAKAREAEWSEIKKHVSIGICTLLIINKSR